jgi:hypothetical protein
MELFGADIINRTHKLPLDKATHRGMDIGTVRHIKKIRNVISKCIE